MPINAASQQTAATNGLAWKSTLRGKALYCSSNTQSSSNVATGTPLSITGKTLSCGAWVYPTISNAFQCIISCSNNAQNAGRQYQLSLNQAGVTELYYTLNFGGAAGSVTVSPSWVVNAWNHVFMTYDGSTARFYLNGSQAGTVSTSVTLTNNTGLYVWFGAEDNSNYGLDGYIDCPAIWNRTLSANEVADFYANPWQVFTPILTYGSSLILVNGSAALTANSQLVAVGSVQHNGISALSGVCTITAAGKMLRGGKSTMSATSVLIAAAKMTRGGKASLAETTILAGTGVCIHRSTAYMPGSSTFNATGTLITTIPPINTDMYGVITITSPDWQQAVITEM